MVSLDACKMAAFMYEHLSANKFAVCEVRGDVAMEKVFADQVYCWMLKVLLLNIAKTLLLFGYLATLASNKTNWQIV